MKYTAIYKTTSHRGVIMVPKKRAEKRNRNRMTAEETS